ncbi:DoxX family protein [Labilibacter sediminis]|nr:DoxX family protein [Labilibacter sediminis]
MFRFIFTLSRIIVGITFLFSGFVKAVDPAGSAIKFTDYLTAFHLDSLTFMVMPLAFILAAIEFLTGIHLLLGIKVKSFSVIATLFMAFFTPLTLVLAITNPVTDCGCFGDALILSNWETFAKNVIILIPTLFLYFNRKKYSSTVERYKQFILTIGFTVGILSISNYSLKHLPILDFRPYKTGSNISEGMQIPEDAEQTEYSTTFILEKDGVKKVFTAENYPYTDSTWVFVDSETTVIKEGYQPPIHDFVLIDDNGEDQTNNILEDDRPTLLIISPKIEKGEWGKNLNKIVELKKTLFEKGYNTYAITASTEENITNFEFNTEAGFNYLIADETMLKTVIRSNPGLVLLQKGNVVGKWHYNDIPNADDFKNPVSYGLKDLTRKKGKFLITALILASALFSVILLKKNK